MKTLIVGRGEVGRALYDVLSKYHDTYIKDLEDLEIKGIEILQIAYPEHDGFSDTTKKYIDQYKPKLTIINSSVALGTTVKCGPNVVYSPVRGRHPKLSTDLLIYSKFVFGGTQEDRDLACSYFQECGMNTSEHEFSTTGELLKLLSNVHMGIEVAWRQELERMFVKFNVDEFAYQDWERSYRNGYLRSDDMDLIRPMMNAGPIGGHCILPCTEILNKQFPSKILDFVLESNAKTKGDK